MLDGKSILIVEDEAFVAVDLSIAVEGMNGMVVGPVATVGEALKLLEFEVVSAAILDAQLIDRDVTPVAVRLKEQGIPFVIHTGTGIPVELARVHPNIRVVLKPVPATAVMVCLAAEINDCDPAARKMD